MRKRPFAVIAIILGIPILAWKGVVYGFHLHRVPQDMGVWQVRYVAEKEVGDLLFPGSRAAGIIVYDMPEATYAALQAGGMAWLEDLSEGDRSRGRRRYGVWRATPAKENWADPSDCATRSGDFWNITQHPTCPSIAAYMGRHLVVVPFDADVEKMANDALFSEGAFYAFSGGGIGMLIAIPEKRRLIYAYQH